MATYSKQLLSGSTNGKGIKIANTSTTVHTAVAGTSDIDEIWLYAVNSSGSDVKLTVEWGGTTDPDDHIEVTITAEAGLTLVAPGIPLQNGLIVKAKGATTNVILIHGYVNRITASQMFRQDRTNPSTAISNWRGRHDTPKAWPSTGVSTWLNGGLFGAPVLTAFGGIITQYEESGTT